MPTFFSPEGNPEIWKEKPEGYLSVEEWNEKNPPIVVETSLLELKEMKIKTLEGIYNNTLKNINFVSSLSFNFSANDTSCINIESLINNLNSDYSKTVQIYDTNNNQHELTLNQLKVLRSEILHTRNLLLQNKNNLIKKIEFAESSTALDEIIFDFSLYF